jgi:cyclopropane fatty-acyl-phospholipid synthase-like methyltransferase
MTNELKYNGAFYAEVGDFIKENYLEYGFTKGTLQEVDFLINELKLAKGAKTLDIGCGAGRHSLELARRGFESVGIDISSGLVEVAKNVASKEKLNATFNVQDARRLEFQSDFDAAICLCEGAFGLAGDEAGHRDILQGVYRALKPGGSFVLTAISALSGIRNAKAESFDPYTLTDIFDETITSPDRETKEVRIYTTAFTYRELKWLLQDAGFDVVAAYGCVAGKFERKPLTLENIEIMMVAKKGKTP